MYTVHAVVTTMAVGSVLSQQEYTPTKKYYYSNSTFITQLYLVVGSMYMYVYTSVVYMK